MDDSILFKSKYALLAFIILRSHIVTLREPTWKPTGKIKGKSRCHTISCTLRVGSVADLVPQAIFSSYYKNCPAEVALSPRQVSWWNKELNHLNASARWLFNKAKWTGDWESYKIALTNYNKEMRKAK